MTKRQNNASLLNENNLIALKDQNGKAVHIVFPDKTSGDLRICRPMMLDDTCGSRPPEWEVVGRATGPKYYRQEVEKLGRRLCGHCLSHLPVQE